MSALDVKTAEEVQEVLIHPPDQDKYTTLKKALIKAFGKSQAQKDNELLNLNGLGDRRPTALLRKINALNDDPRSLKRALFLANLPSEIRNILAGQEFRETEDLAEAADRVWESLSATASVRQVQQMPHANIPPTCNTTVEAVAPLHTKPHNVFKASTTPASAVCFYHMKFGSRARNCQPGCKFSSCSPRHREAPTPAARRGSDRFVTSRHAVC